LFQKRKARILGMTKRELPSNAERRFYRGKSRPGGEDGGGAKEDFTYHGKKKGPIQASLVKKKGGQVRKGDVVPGGGT